MLRGIGKPYVKSLDSPSDLPPDPPYGSNWGNKIANFVSLPDISFILALIDLFIFNYLGFYVAFNTVQVIS